MQMPLQITIRGFPQSEALDARIRKKVGKLDSFCAHIMSCRVLVEMPHKHRHHGKQFHVGINIGVPGSEIVVSADAEDAYVAVRDAFDAAGRQLQDYTQRLRGETKTHEPRDTDEAGGSYDSDEESDTEPAGS